LYLQSIHKNYDSLKKYTKLYDDANKVEFSLFNYSFTYDIYANSSSRLSFPKKYYRTINGIINLQYELMKNQKNILLNYFELKKNNQLDKFDKFFIPRTINIFFDYSRIENYYQEKQTIETKNLLKKLLNQIIPNRPIDDFFTILKEISNLLNNPNSYEKPKNDFDFFNPSFELGNTDDENIYFNLWEDKDCISKIDLKQYLNNNVLETINHYLDYISDLKLKVLSFDIDELNIETHTYFLGTLDLNSNYNIKLKISGDTLDGEIKSSSKLPDFMIEELSKDEPIIIDEDEYNKSIMFQEQNNQ